ncbi:MAG: hypothetical protein K2W82_18145 [Candidatus Obscuribacterales bacterium]|nr:hypothetical protein [Candidatus Obscuribacterales bacterium]
MGLLLIIGGIYLMMQGGSSVGLGILLLVLGLMSGSGSSSCRRRGW